MGNPLATEKIGKLMARFCIPAVIGMVVSALYNFVDQIFIGHGVGIFGNAATNVEFPINTVAMAMSLLVGIGTATFYNLSAGKGEKEKGVRAIGNGMSIVVIIGLIIMAAVLIFLKPLLIALGSTEEILPYAVDYTWIVALGIPAYMLGFAGSHFIRSDGAPTFSMWANISGAILNLILDPIFIFVFHWGMKGAAIATVIGQFLSAVLVIFYFSRKSNMKIKKSYLIPDIKLTLRTMGLGVPASIHNVAIAVTQIVINNVIRKYGISSIYGVEIPLAVVGITQKILQIYTSIYIGIHQGCLPIYGFNYGSKNYERVMKAYNLGIAVVIVIGIVFTAAFEIFPKQILSLFGTGSELYYAYAVRFFRIYMSMTIFVGIFHYTAGFFTGCGKTIKGLIPPVTKQIVTMIPLALILSIFLGLDGITWTGPISDVIVGIMAIIFVKLEFTDMKKKIIERDAQRAAQ